MTNTAAAAATTAPATEKDCLCGKFEIVLNEYELENGQPEIETEGTGCNARTTRDFAPGHDAKLKSLLIKAGVQGLEVRQDRGGVVHSGDARTMAANFAFAYMVDKGIETGRAKAQARAARAAAPKAERKPSSKAASQERAAALTEKMAAKVAKAEAPATAPETVTIKLGRWEYAGVRIVNGDAHYTNKQGAEMVAVQGTYKIIG